MTQKTPLIVSALRREKTDRTPIWLMRQAGRYLPEYRELRAKAGGFLNMAYDPEMASEITLQPIRRFGMDGAIIFSDILVIPHAMGQALNFEAGEGPRFEPLDMKKLKPARIDETLRPVYDALFMTRAKLDVEGFKDTALIGFCGAPWTVACYMIEGRGSSDFAKARQFVLTKPKEFGQLIDMLVEASLHYLTRQISAGAQVIQIFESWAGIVDEYHFDDLIIAPTQKLIAGIKRRFPDIPVIGFPRGVTPALLARYAAETGIDGLSCDEQHAPRDLKKLQPHLCLQGNLSSAALLEGGEKMEEAARDILSQLADGWFIFNLGHGVFKETPPEHVGALVKLVQEYRP